MKDRYALVKTMQGNYYYCKAGYNNFDFTTNPVKINSILIPLSNIEYIRLGLSYNEVMDIVHSI